MHNMIWECRRSWEERKATEPERTSLLGETFEQECNEILWCELFFRRLVGFSNPPRLVIWTEHPEKSLWSKWQNKPAYKKLDKRGEDVWQRHASKGGTVSWKGGFYVTSLIKLGESARDLPESRNFSIHVLFGLPTYCMLLHVCIQPIHSSEEKTHTF